MRILLLDDDVVFRKGLALHLRKDGHEVVEYDSPTEIPDLDGLGELDLVLTDYQMQGKDGLAFADDFHGLHRDVPVVMLTAYWSQHLDGEVSRRQFLRLLQKPVDYFQLHDLIHSLRG
jgi:DNA-binding NtrC family response regulator